MRTKIENTLIIWMPLLTLTVPVSIYYSLHQTGALGCTALIYLFAICPLIELIIPPVNKNLTPKIKEKISKYFVLDWFLYLILPIQLFLLFTFFNIIKVMEIGTFDWTVNILSMGFNSGVLGINVAHELGHRKEKSSRLQAIVLLMTSLYAQFYIEHNKGHHRHVSTPQDPATSRLNETIFLFQIRSIMMAFLSAWKLDRKMSILFIICQISLVAVIGLFLGSKVMLAFILSACFGIFLLEAVNYIEHYGLMRKINPSGRYEKVTPIHSWNSNHLVGRALLFNLSRHSDHHAFVSKEYYLLDNYNHSPQMPTGYPGMILLAMVPPLWFKVMNKRVLKYQAE